MKAGVAQEYRPPDLWWTIRCDEWTRCVNDATRQIFFSWRKILPPLTALLFSLFLGFQKCISNILRDLCQRCFSCKKIHPAPDVLQRLVCLMESLISVLRPNWKSLPIERNQMEFQFLPTMRCSGARKAGAVKFSNI